MVGSNLSGRKKKKKKRHFSKQKITQKQTNNNKKTWDIEVNLHQFAEKIIQSFTPIHTFWYQETARTFISFNDHLNVIIFDFKYLYCFVYSRLKLITWKWKASDALSRVPFIQTLFELKRNNINSKVWLIWQEKSWILYTEKHM